jgi:hypothetical protein
MKKVKDKGLAGDVDRVELIMRWGAGFKDKKYGIKDGYLLLEGKTVHIEGFPLLFIKVIAL